MLPERLWVYKKISFIKKNFIYNEKSGTVTKVKLRKIKKHNELYFGTLVSASYCYCADNTRNTDFFQNNSFKESNNMVVKKISD